MPVGEVRFTNALFAALSNEPLVTEAIQSMIFRKTADYAQKQFGLSISRNSINEAKRQLIEGAETHRTEDAVVYGLFKGESTIAGANGVITRRVAKETTKDVIRQLGIDKILQEARNLLEVTQKFADILAMVGHINRDKTVLKDLGDNGVEMILSGNCPHLNVCQQLRNEGVYDVFGNVPCTLALGFAAASEIVFRVPFDITLKELNPPNCKVILHEL